MMLLTISPLIQTELEVSSQEDSIPRMTMSFFMPEISVDSVTIADQLLIYLDRMATTGSIFAAIMAGIIPAKTPMETQMPIAKVRILKET